MTNSKKKTKLQKEVYEKLYRVGPVVAAQAISKTAVDAYEFRIHIGGSRSSIKSSGKMRSILWDAKKSIDVQNSLSKDYIWYLLEVKLKFVFRDIRAASALNANFEKALVDSL